MTQFWFAFGLTLLAGLSTGIGSAIAFFARRANTRFLSVALGFSAGVMIYIALVEMVPASARTLDGLWGAAGGWAAFASFFGGIGVSALIDMTIPSIRNPHEPRKDARDLKALQMSRSSRTKLLRVGLLTAAALALHNFPEGLATFMSGLHSPAIAVSIAVAIAIHNIPEGIAVSVPIFYATGSRKKAFAYSFLSGLAEPVGALIGYALLRPFFGEAMFGVIFALVGGIMVYISFDEMLPAAQEYGEHHCAIAGLFAGMSAMAASLILF